MSQARQIEIVRVIEGDNVFNDRSIDNSIRNPTKPAVDKLGDTYVPIPRPAGTLYVPADQFELWKSRMARVSTQISPEIASGD